MGKIFLEARKLRNPLLSGSKYRHMYLVYENDAGSEFVIGGQRGDSIFVEVAIPMNSNGKQGDGTKGGGSIDSRLKKDRAKFFSTELRFDGQDPDVVWKHMQQQAQAIADAKIPYDTEFVSRFESSNSNTTVASVLRAVGIDVLKVLPRELSYKQVPGAEGLFEEYRDLLNVTLRGSKQGDILRGSYGNDDIAGMNDSDLIYGGEGNDELTGSGGAGNRGEIDVVIGGQGADIFYVTNLEAAQDNFSSSGKEIRRSGKGERARASIVEAEDFLFIADFNEAQGDRINGTAGVRYLWTTVSNEVVFERVGWVRGNEMAFGIYEEYRYPLNGFSRAMVADVDKNGLISNKDELVAVLGMPLK